MSDAAPAAGHILVVDDDERLRILLRKYLTQCGFIATLAADAAQARQLIQALDFDLVILDVMMPGEDGFSLTRALRATSEVPILLLTARDLPGDRIEGLRLGADDYLAKPFEPEELVLRIEAILRRARAAAPAASLTEVDTVVFGPFRFTCSTGELTRAGAPVRLPAGEAQLLAALARAGGRVVAREELAEQAGATQERSVDVQVTRLRRKIEDDPREPVHLQTVRGTGYKLVAAPAPPRPE